MDKETLGFLVVEVTRMLRAEFENRIMVRGFALTAGEARALVRVHRGEPIRQKLLADKLGLDTMTVSQYLDRLEARDLIYRSPDPDDRRAKLIRTTPKAASYVQEIKSIGQGIDQDIMHTLSETERHEFMQNLIQVHRTLKEIRTQAAAK